VSVSGGSRSDTYTPYGNTCTSNNIANPTRITGNAYGPGSDFFGMVPVNVGGCQVIVAMNGSGSSGVLASGNVGVSVAGSCLNTVLGPSDGLPYCLWEQFDGWSGTTSIWDGGATGCAYNCYAINTFFAEPPLDPRPSVVYSGGGVNGPCTTTYSPPWQDEIPFAQADTPMGTWSPPPNPPTWWGAISNSPGFGLADADNPNVGIVPTYNETNGNCTPPSPAPKPVY
jgi:hypothetical protein